MTPQERALLDLLVEAYPSPGTLFQRVGFSASEILQSATGREIWHNAFPKLQKSDLLGKLVVEVLSHSGVALYHERIRVAWRSLSEPPSSMRLFDAEVEDLLSALSRLAPTEDTLIGAFLRVVPAGGFGTSLAEKDDLLRALCISLTRQTLGTQVPPLLRFANLVNNGEDDDIRAHIDRIVKRLESRPEIPRAPPCRAGGLASRQTVGESMRTRRSAWTAGR